MNSAGDRDVDDERGEEREDGFISKQHIDTLLTTPYSERERERERVEIFIKFHKFHYNYRESLCD